MRPSKLAAHTLGVVLVRAMFLVALIGGVVAMHTLGHPDIRAHNHGQAEFVGVAASDSIDSTSAGMGGAVVGLPGGVGSASSDTDDASHCPGGHAPGCPEREFDHASVCMAVLTAAVALTVGLLQALPASWAAAFRGPSLIGVAGRGCELPPPRTPSLAQLAVLRI